MTFAETHVAKYVGDHSAYYGMTIAQRQRALAAAAKPGVAYKEPIVRACITWVLQTLRAGFEEAIAKEPPGPARQKLVNTRDQMNAAAKASSLTGFDFMRPLMAAGWKVYVFAPDSKNIDTHDPENRKLHLTQITQAHLKGYYYQQFLKVSGFIEDYRPTTDEEALLGNPVTVKQTEMIDRLKKCPWWFGTAKVGYHSFVGHGSVVNEFHWDREPNDPDAIAESELKDFVWSHGFIAVPPGEWDPLA